MRFTPDHVVSYRGEFHRAGKPFDIREEDAAEMSRYGRIEPTEEQPTEEPPRRGRPPKK